ncbi:MAG: sulfatase [Candidatus Levybacteria bacterium]|nr:sulfatase [Candidatus Levybacteria bacterium]
MPRSAKKTSFRNKILLFLAILILIPLVLFAYQQQQVRLSDKPNIIIILTDDQRADTLQYMPIVQDRLGGEGVTFSNAYATTPLCCPSRVSLYTGLYAHNTNVWTNHMPNKGDFPLGGFDAFGGSAGRGKDDETIAVWLKRVGYRTGFAGKYLNGYKSRYIPPGFDDWHGVVRNTYYGYDMNENGRIVSYGFKPKDYSTDVYTDKAVNFIKKTKQPFFFVVSTDAVHTDGGKSAPNDPRNKNKKNKKNRLPNVKSPLDEDRDDPDQVKDYYAMPAPEDRENCEEHPWEQSAAVNEADVSDKSEFIKAIKPLSNQDMADINRFRESQICALQGVDRAIKRIVDVLGDRRDNTAIIFIGDNGFSWGEHRLSKKNCLYEECAKVPLVISYPKLTKTRDVNSSFVLNIDIASTIAQLAGVRIPVKVNGKSLVPLFTDPQGSVRSDFLLEIYNSRKGYKNIDYAIRTSEYKYTELSSGEKELYDFTTDQYELVNQINNPTYTPVVQELAGKLEQLKTE